MDTLKTLKRLCNSKEKCEDCALQKNELCMFKFCPNRWRNDQIEMANRVLKHWSGENPPKTRGQAFLERNPEAATNFLKLPLIRPCDYLGYGISLEECEANKNCAECVEKFWGEPVE